MGDGVRGWDLETGLSGSQQLLEFSIFDDTGGLVAFSDPFHKVSAIIKIRVGNMELSQILTGLPYWYVIGESTERELGLDEQTAKRWRHSA